MSALSSSRGRERVVALALSGALALAGAAAATEWLAGDHLAAAARSIRARDFAAAARALEGVLAADPRDARARYALVQCLIESNRLDDALATARAGTTADPTSGHAWAAMGDVQMRLGDFEEGRQSYVRGVQAGVPRARLGLAVLLESEREVRAARVQFEHAYRDDPGDPQIVFGMATAAASRTAALELLAVGLARDFYLELHERASIHGYLESRAQLDGGGNCEPAGEPRTHQIRLRKIRPSAEEQDRVGAKVSLNGKKPFVSLLDTGASGLIITEREAERAGATRLADVTYRGIGEQGERPAYLARVERLAIGDLVFTDCIVRVTDSANLQGVLGGHGSLMGFDLFYNDFEVTLDFGAGLLRLLPLPPLPRTEDGQRDFFSYERDTRKLGAGYLPVRIFGSHLLIPTLVNSSLKAYFLLDTGASTNLLSERFAAQSRTLRPSGVTVRGLSGDIENVKAVSNVQLTVGGILQQHDSVLALDLDGLAVASGYGFDGIVGYDLLRHAVVSIDFRNALVKIARGRH